MIVRCEKCETRFKLDETRLPARGARVRCSRCKHAFFVTPPQADREAVLQGLAEEVTQGRARAPEPSWDLDEPEGGSKARGRAEAQGGGRKARERGEEKRARGDRTQSERASALSAPEADEDWTFEDQVPGLAGDASSLDLHDSDAGAAPLGDDPNESSFAGLGDPESWDLLAPPTPSPPARAPERPAAVRRAPAPEPPAETARRPQEPVAKAAPAEAVAAAPVAPAESTQKAVASSWPALAGVAALGIALLWGSVHSAARAEGRRALAPVGGLEIASARARWIENAVAGQILVVSGELRNPGPTPRSLGSGLVVTLLDAGGSPIDEPEAVAASPLEEKRLREEDPRQLRSEQQGASGGWAAREIAPGATLAFDAVFERFPAGARRFDLATRSIAAAREARAETAAQASAAAPLEAVPAPSER